MSKGDNRRPAHVSAQHVDSEWDRIFNKKFSADIGDMPVETAQTIIEDIKARQREKDKKN